MKYLPYNTDSISGFPSIEEIKRKKVNNSAFEVTLPVLVLAFFRDPSWNNDNRPAVLLVTDFTVNSNLNLPNGSQKYFTFDGAKKRIDLDKVFAISVPIHSFQLVASRLYSCVDQHRYDFSKFDQCLIDSEKIIVKVKFTLKQYNGKIESWLVTDQLQVHDEVLSDDIDKRRVRGILDRYDREPDDVYEQEEDDTTYGLNENYGEYDEVPQSMPPPPNNVLHVEHPAKRVKTVTFSQMSDSLDDFSQDFLRATKPERGIEPEPQSQPQEPDHSLQHKRDLEELEDDQRDNPATQLEFSQLLPYSPPPKQIQSDLVTETVRCVIKDFIPSKFIIKPFARTLKIAPFKMFVQTKEDNHNKVFELEFITESEICHFLGLKEVEEALEALPIIENQIRHLRDLGENDSELSIKIQKKSHLFLSSMVERYYWTSLTPLGEL